MIDINNIRCSILLHGKLIHDVNLNRSVRELIAQEYDINSTLINYLNSDVALNTKYEPELNDIKEWYELNFPKYSKDEHRRHIVYFNSNDYNNRLQCISLFQVLDNTMIVYQRSSDTIKMLDDFRFFVEIKNRYFANVDHIKIFYGSLHTKIEDNE